MRLSRAVAYTMVVLIAAACSQPTRAGPSAREILLAFADPPVAALPPMTEANQDNPGYIQTVQYLTDLAASQAYFVQWSRILLDEHAEPAEAHYYGASDDSFVVWRDYVWVRHHSDGQSAFTLKVDVYVNRWEGVLTLSGPAYTEYPSDYLLALMYRPDSGYGAFEETTSDRFLNWYRYDQATDTHGFLHGEVAAVYDSTDGGGVLYVRQYVFWNTVFGAHWDNVGHGSYYTDSESGSW